MTLSSRASADDPFQFFQQEGQAVTALRRPQAVGEAPAAVDVITREEIEASGAVSLCDLLRFRPGLDVIDGRSLTGESRCVVSIRGMARDQVTELLVLIDGRSTYSPLSGAILWQALPVQMQDIERVEIVRGPNAALYGQGAGLGVINIITRTPRSRATASAAGAGGSLGTAITEEAFEDARGKFGYRLSHSFQENGSYPSMVDGANPNDFLHRNQANLRSYWKPDPDTSVEVLAGGSWLTDGQADALLGFNDPQNRIDTHFETVRLSRSLDEDDVVQFNASRNDQNVVQDPSPGTGGSQSIRYWLYDLEALQSFGWDDGAMHTTWGASYRYASAYSDYLFGQTPVQVDRVIRGYVHQTAKLSDRWSVIGGVSLEQPYFAGTRHADYQAALLYEARRGHTLRAAYSVAYTDPGLSETASNFSPEPFLNVVGNPSLKSYELQNYELGYKGELSDRRASLGASVYYMKIRDHDNQDVTNPGGVPIDISFFNDNFLIARGAELEARYRVGPGRSAYANLSDETVSDRDGHTLYIKTTPHYIFNAGFIAALGRGFTASANASWKDGYLADSVSGTDQLGIEPFWRLDARLSYKPVSWLELFVTGHNLLMPRHVEYVDGLAVPRVFFGGAKLRFR